MSGDPIERLPTAFGRVLARRRSAKPGTSLALAGAVGLTENKVIAMERGQREPVLTEFFRIARALGDPPTILLIDVITTWLDADTLHATRAADFTRLYRLGYHHKPGDFRELGASYYSVPEAAHAAGKLNGQRHARGVALIDTICVYVRLDYVSLGSDSGQGRGATS
jgi:transcriptional regulator with XRE-family HTH domain